MPEETGMNKVKTGMDKFKEGLKKFHADKYEGDNKAIMQDLIDNGQHPEALVIGCCDSRTSPANIMDTEPGELFVERHIAALVPPYEEGKNGDQLAAAIDYPVEHLGIKHVIIMGHTHCGGIAGLVEGVKEGSFGSWLQRASDVIDRVKLKSIDLDDKAFLTAVEREAIVWSLENLKEYPSVKAAMAKGELEVHGWQFDLRHGFIYAFDEASEKFEKLIEFDSPEQSCCSHAKSKKPE